MIDAIESFHFAYELMSVNINRVFLDGGRPLSGWRRLCGGSAAIVVVKSNTTFILCDVEHRIYLTSLLPVQEGTCTLACTVGLDLHWLVRMSKQLKFAGRICVWSRVLFSRCIFIVSSVRSHGKKGCRCSVTTRRLALVTPELADHNTVADVGASNEFSRIQGLRCLLSVFEITRSFSDGRNVQTCDLREKADHHPDDHQHLGDTVGKLEQ